MLLDMSLQFCGRNEDMVPVVLVNDRFGGSTWPRHRLENPAPRVDGEERTSALTLY
jgi:hypothetical protein